MEVRMNQLLGTKQAFNIVCVKFRYPYVARPQSERRAHRPKIFRLILIRIVRSLVDH